MDQQTVLIVEDHPPLREALRSILEADGYRVWIASDGSEALRSLEERLPDLIVSDILMPEMDGYAFCQAVRAREEWASIPFVFLTVKAKRDDILKGKALGVDDYLTKPLHPRELLVTIRAQLGRAEAMQAAAATEFEALKEDLVTVLGHELRTPLTYIRCYADLALENTTSDDEEAEAYWSGVRHGADRLTRLAEDVALLTQLGTEEALNNLRAKMDVREDLGEILRLVVCEYEVLAMDEGIALEAEIEADLPPVHLQTSLFVDAVGRLLDNAIKFSRGKEGSVSLRAQRVDDGAEIAVTDEGVGIPAEEMAHLFDRFHQIDREDLEQQGLGIGLALAQRVIEMHQGEITAESEWGEGSTFTIRLPAAEMKE
jgi:signal transduction histidine kinase